MELHWYEYRLRGFSPGCQPTGWVDVDHNRGKWGAIAYNRELTDKEIDAYELRQLNPS